MRWWLVEHVCVPSVSTQVKSERQRPKLARKTNILWKLNCGLTTSINKQPDLNNFCSNIGNSQNKILLKYDNIVDWLVYFNWHIFDLTGSLEFRTPNWTPFFDTFMLTGQRSRSADRKGSFRARVQIKNTLKISKSSKNIILQLD